MKIVVENVVYNCTIIGTGSIKVLAFHGFGQDGASFRPIEKAHKDLTIFAIDLPFHGGTSCDGPPRVLLNDKHVQSLVGNLIESTGISTFSLLGFSIGARFLFPIISKFHVQIRKVWLLAPDGISENFWFRIATFSPFNRWIFRGLLANDHLIGDLGRALSKLNVLDPRTLSFALRTIDSKKKREDLCSTWIALRGLKMDMHAMAGILNKEHIKTSIFLGEQDLMIREASVKAFSSMLDHKELIYLRCKHHRMIECFAGQKIRYD